MNELRKASCEDASSLHNFSCSPFSLAELSTATSKLSTSTASGPDQIAYRLLKYLPEPTQLPLLSLFNRSWYSHTFSHRRSQDFWLGGPKPQITCNDVVRNFQERKFLWSKDIAEWKFWSRCLLAHNQDFGKGRGRKLVVRKCKCLT